MPYIKEKGVRDIYLIRVARIGNKAEIRPESGDIDPRIVFELKCYAAAEPLLLQRHITGESNEQVVCIYDVPKRKDCP